MTQIRLTLVLLIIGFLAAGLAQVDTPAQAATVVGGQTVVVLDGNTAYTTTKYTAGYLSGSFGEIVLQVESDISGTATLTVTPQFAINQTACGSMAAGDWVDAVIVDVFVTGATTYTAALQQIAVRDTLAGDGDALLRFPVMGRCFRIKLQSTTTYTPALYAWMVNTQ
jgi:hypothetical protein